MYNLTFLLSPQGYCSVVPSPRFKILLEEISSGDCINRAGNAGTRTRRRAVVMGTEADEEKPFINVHVQKF